jgi:hypothetical protein
VSTSVRGRNTRAVTEAMLESAMNCIKRSPAFAAARASSLAAARCDGSRPATRETSNWNSDPVCTDAAGRYGPTTDPLYQSHPFFLSVTTAPRSPTAPAASRAPASSWTRARKPG